MNAPTIVRDAGVPGIRLSDVCTVRPVRPGWIVDADAGRYGSVYFLEAHGDDAPHGWRMRRHGDLAVFVNLEFHRLEVDVRLCRVTEVVVEPEAFSLVELQGQDR